MDDEIKRLMAACGIPARYVVDATEVLIRCTEIVLDEDMDNDDDFDTDKASAAKRLARAMLLKYGDAKFERLMQAVYRHFGDSWMLLETAREMRQEATRNI